MQSQKNNKCIVNIEKTSAHVVYVLACVCVVCVHACVHVVHMHTYTHSYEQACKSVSEKCRKNNSLNRASWDGMSFGMQSYPLE